MGGMISGTTICKFNCLDKDTTKGINSNQTIKLDNKHLTSNLTSNNNTTVIEPMDSPNQANKRKSNITSLKFISGEDAFQRRHSSIYTGSTIFFQTSNLNLNLNLSKVSKSARGKAKGEVEIGNVQMKKAYRNLPDLKAKDSNNSTIITSNSFILNQLSQSPSPKRRDAKPIETINKPFTEKQLQLLMELLKNEEMIVPQMDEEAINAILNTITYVRVAKGVQLYSNENKIDNIFYLIEKGKMSYTLDGETSVLRKHDSIGTKALRLNAKTATLQTVDRTYLFCLPIEKYKTIFQDFIERDMTDKVTCLKKCFFFNFLENKCIAQLASCCIKRKYEMRSEVIAERTQPTCVYVVTNGTVFCVKNEVVLCKKKENEVFGEVSLFSEKASLYGYLADVNSAIIEIPYQEIEKVLGKNHIKALMFGLFSNSIKKCDYLSKHLAGDRLKPAFKAFQIGFYTDEQVTNAKSKRIFIPITGTFTKDTEDVEIKNNESQRLNRAHKHLLPEQEPIQLGELYLAAILSQKSPRIMCTNHCVVLQANWSDVLKNTKCLLKKCLSMYDMINKFRNYKLFKYLSEVKLLFLADLFVLYTYKDKQVILKEGPSSSQLYLIQSGNGAIVTSSNVEIKTFKEGDIFGDIISKSDAYLKKADFVAKGPVDCWTLAKAHYEEVIENNLLLNPFKALLEPKDASLTLDSLYYVKELGFGTYGKVYLVHNGKRFYAMKTADIQQMCGHKLLSQYYINEKTIMQSIDHPFIVHLMNTYKTRDYIFFLMEFVEGTALRNYIEQKTRDCLRNNAEIYFYGGILFHVLNYLQKNRIIHRDFKPDNLIIDRKGYLKVIDFGIAKDLAGKDSTQTLIGTPHYMAPEIILGKKYSFAVDYWAVGIILFELFYGKFPFGTDATDGTAVFTEITEKKLAYPSDPKNKIFNDLIKHLLYKNPQKRIRSFLQIKAHDFFKEYDFDQLSNMTAKPFHLPNLKANEHSLDNTSQSFESFLMHTVYSSTKDVMKNLSTKLQDNNYLSEF